MISNSYYDIKNACRMGGGGESESNDASIIKVNVRYKFKNDEKEYREWMTMIQFKNLQSLSITEYCEIISK